MLLDAKRSVLAVIDLQERLMPAIAAGADVVRRAGMLIEGARVLGVPVLVSEQYPKGLGRTLAPIAERLPNDASVVSKLTFSAARSEDFMRHMTGHRAAGRDQAVLCGAETHICVLQTAAALAADGVQVFLATDASGSRTERDRAQAVDRLAALGVHCVTTEMVLFEWLEAAGSAEFKAIAKLVK